VPLVESRVGVLENQLAVLLGEPPGTQIARPPAALPALPPLPSTGLPAELLARRPDVRAAQLRVMSADNRVGVAIAALLPTLTLSATGSYSGRSIAEIFDLRFWSIAADVFAPIFEGHRRTAEVDRARAVLRELLTAYTQAVLRAFQEVEDALVQERRQRDFLVSLDEQVSLAEATLREARLQYANGLGEYLNVLTALSALQRLERDRLTAQQQLVAFRIQLYRALAGSWPADLIRKELPGSGEGE
jgi:outer membrane protein TolC